MTQSERMAARIVVAVRFWLMALPAAVWKERAWKNSGAPWYMPGREPPFSENDPWCGSWADLVDMHACGGPDAWARSRLGVSTLRRCGVGPRGLRSPEWKPRPGRTAKPGDIATVGGGAITRGMDRKARLRAIYGAHVVVVVHVTERGVCTISGNGAGYLANGRRTHGDVVAAFYEWAEVKQVVTPPDSAYPSDYGEAPGPKEVVEALHSVRAYWHPGD